MASVVYVFGEFCLDSSRRKLLKGETEVRLGDNELDLLIYLIDSRPNVCRSDEIIANVWRETSVERNSVEKAIVNLRKALGDDAKAPLFIKNRRGAGYALICEVSEMAPSSGLQSVDTNFVDAHRERKSPHENYPNNTVRISFVFVAAILVVFLVFAGLFFSQGTGVLARIGRSNILNDDFSSKELNPDLWTVSGNGMRINDGIVKVACWETDNCGRLVSRFLPFDPTKALMVEARIKVQPRQDFTDKQYFLSFFGLVPKNANIADLNTRDHSVFGVYYVDYDFESMYPTGEVDEFPADGWFLFRNGGSPQKKIDHFDGKIGKRVPPLWDTWFDQKIIYNPKEATLSFFINEKLFDVFKVGDLFANIEENKIRVEIAPRGWWLNHSIEVDDIRAYQEPLFK